MVSRKISCRLVFTKRSIWYGILSKPNCTEKAPRITGENGRKSPAKTGLKATAQGGRQNDAPASPKQLSYLLDLARQRGITPQQIAVRFQVPDIQHLTRQQCSDQIDEWRAA